MGAPSKNLPDNLRKPYLDFLNRWEFHLKGNSEEIPSYTEIFHPTLNTIAQQSNTVESGLSSLNHSEILAIHEAHTKLNEKFLNQCTLFTSIEPCMMCAGAIVKSRIQTVIFTLPHRLGTGISSYSIEAIYLMNHFPKIYHIPNPSTLASMKEFFQKKRN